MNQYLQAPLQLLTASVHQRKSMGNASVCCTDSLFWCLALKKVSFRTVMNVKRMSPLCDLHCGTVVSLKTVQLAVMRQKLCSESAAHSSQKRDFSVSSVVTENQPTS